MTVFSGSFRMTTLGILQGWGVGKKLTIGTQIQQMTTQSRCPQVEWTRVSDRVEHFGFLWVCLKNLCTSSATNLSMLTLTHTCDVQLTTFYLVVRYACFSRMSCLQDFTFLNINLTTCRMLILYFKNSTSRIVMRWSGSCGRRIPKTGPVDISGQSDQSPVTVTLC